MSVDGKHNVLTLLSFRRRKQNPANPLTRASVAGIVYSAVLGMSLIFVVSVVVVVFLFNVHGKQLWSCLGGRLN